MRGVDNTVSLQTYAKGKNYNGGNYPIGGDYRIAGDYPIGGTIRSRRNINIGTRSRLANEVEDHIIKDRIDTENLGGGFFDDVLGPYAPVIKKIVGGKQGGAIEDFIPLAEKTGKALGWLAIKALGGNIKSNDSNAVINVRTY